MSFTKLFLCSVLTISILASPLLSRNETQQWEFAEIPPSMDLVWYPCDGPFFCAMLDVPLDYTKPRLGRAYVPVIKYPATTTPYKGIVLTNPGGPGGSGVQFLEFIAELGATIVGSNYDLVSWDPRGVQNSIPHANCKLSPDLTGSPAKLLRRELDKLYGPTASPMFFEAAYAQAQEIAAECAASIGAPKDAGPHMTTATVARDMLSIIDAFKNSQKGRKCKDKGLLNYWGISYGTFLGQTFASMFPDRIGRVILDGVVDADEWINYTGRNLVTYADETFSTFFLYCNLAGPSACPFFTGTTPHDIFQRFEDIVLQLDPVPAFANGWANATAIELLLGSIKAVLFTYSYSPILTFPTIAFGLVVVEAALPEITLEKVDLIIEQLGLNITGGIPDQYIWRQAITCTDVGDVVKGRPLESFAERIKEFEGVSFLAGEGRVADLFPCTGWNISSDYRFTGPFGGRTRNPILFVSNTLDPITPIDNGKKGIKIFEAAELLIIEGAGHSAEATQNKCAYAKFNRFFQTGELPGSDNYCPLEAGPWNVTIAGPLQGRGDLDGVRRGLDGLKGLKGLE